MNFRFENPAAFQFLALVPVLLALVVIMGRRARRLLSKTLGERVLIFLSSNVSVIKRRWRTALELVALICFILALARPQMGSALREIKSEGVEILFLMDVSESMMTEDLKPNRLEVAKRELNLLMDRMSGHKVGLVVFAGSSFLVSPITPDYSAIRMFLDSVNTESVSTQGTEVKNALEAAEEAFERGGASTDEGSQVTRVLLIASDGEDEEEGALKKARELKSKGFRLFTIGFGTEQGGPVPQRDERGYLTGYKKDSKGQTVNSAHSGKFLQELARAGGGNYFYAVAGGQQTAAIMKEIDRMEKAQFETQMATDYNEQYQWILALGFLAALVALLINDRHARPPVWKGRFEVAP